MSNVNARTKTKRIERTAVLKIALIGQHTVVVVVLAVLLLMLIQRPVAIAVAAADLPMQDW